MTHRELRSEYIERGLIALDVEYSNGEIERLPFDKIDNINLEEVELIVGLKWSSEVTIYENK